VNVIGANSFLDDDFHSNIEAFMQFGLIPDLTSPVIFRRMDKALAARVRMEGDAQPDAPDPLSPDAHERKAPQGSRTQSLSQDETDKKHFPPKRRLTLLSDL
jgi:hypothetical protein